MANVRICMIGAGRVGKLHSGTLRRHVPGGELVALVDPFTVNFKIFGPFRIPPMSTSLTAVSSTTVSWKLLNFALVS